MTWRHALLAILLLVLAAVSLWTPLAHAEIAARWFTLPNLFWFLPVPLLVLLSAWGIQRGVKRGAHYSPFLLTLVLIFLGFSGLGISLWPNIIPPAISLWEAAAPPQSHGLYAGRRAVHHSVHPGLHRLELLRVPRQDQP